MEGPTIQKTRWADVDDVWNDETMTKRLYKYLKAYGVHEKYWKENMENIWKGYNREPWKHVEWKTGEELQRRKISTSVEQQECVGGRKMREK